MATSCGSAEFRYLITKVQLDTATLMYCFTQSAMPCSAQFVSVISAHISPTPILPTKESTARSCCNARTNSSGRKDIQSSISILRFASNFQRSSRTWPLCKRPSQTLSELLLAISPSKQLLQREWDLWEEKKALRQ